MHGCGEGSLRRAGRGKGTQPTHHEAVELLRLCAEVSGAVAYAELGGPWWWAGHQRLLHLTHDPMGQRRSGPGVDSPGPRHPHGRTHLSALTYSEGMELQRTPATRRPTSR